MGKFCQKGQCEAGHHEVCSEKECCCECHCSEPCECCEEKKECHLHFLLKTADCAWMEVLKDKIKEHILSVDNDRLKELAKIVSEANRERWKLKKDKKRHCKDFEEKLCNYFSQCKK